MPRLNPPLSILGRVIDRASGFPLARVSVAWLDGAGAGGRVVAQAVTDRQGRFEIVLPRPEVPPRAAGGRPEPGQRAARGAIRVDGGDGAPLMPPMAIAAQPGRVLMVPVPLAAASLTPAIWQLIAERAREARVVRLNEIVSALLEAAPGAGLFDGVDRPTRYAAASALERAFVDPAGRLQGAGLPARLAELADARAVTGWRRQLDGDGQGAASLEQAHARALAFERIGLVDWVIDLDALGAGRLGEAVTAFEEVYLASQSNHDPLLSNQDPTLVAKVFPPSDLSRYRDYLLAIFTGPPGSASFTTRRQQLRGRFHQSFAGHDVTAWPANRLLHRIVKSILVAPANAGLGYGFSVPAATIAPQGDRTDRAYLDALIALSGLSATELGLRYRLDLQRPDTAVSSEVEEHIRTLQGFYTDGFQAVADPTPVIPGGLLGKAPFFLFYTEWLRRSGTFHGENLFDPFAAVGIPAASGVREQLLAVDETQENDPDRRWLIPLLKAEVAIREGGLRFSEMQYAMAEEQYTWAADRLTDALAHLPTAGIAGAPQTMATFAPDLDAWRTMAIDTPEDLKAFTAAVLPPLLPAQDPIATTSAMTEWFADHQDRAQLHLCHLAFVVVPVARGDAALAQGDYARALAFYELTTRFLLGRAHESIPTGWVDEVWGEDASVPEAEAPPGGAGRARVRDGVDPLPYTAALEPDEPLRADVNQWNTYERELKLLFLARLHPMEARFLRLRHAEAMLDWADTLYRTEEASSVQRAREVYKAVLFLHGARPGISPRWGGLMPHVPTGWFRKHDENPGRVSQAARASVALAQIDQGLNWHGLSDGVIPTLRYATLKSAADRFAAAARAAQQDFLAYLGKVEEAIKDEILHANLLERARLQGALAAEQAKLAGIGLEQAEAQVKEVQKAIEEKKTEIEESQDFFNQFVSFIGGMGTAVAGLPTGMTGMVGEGAMAAGGLSAAEGATLTGAAAGGAALAGYGLFVYAGYTSLSNMAEAHGTLHDQLSRLRDKALPLAERQVRARHGELAIARLHGQIAQADAQLALDLMHFQSIRFLSVELWSRLATVVKRLLRRYLGLGARFAWLAERALAFEQNRPLDIVRLDYFPRAQQGLSGADLLQADLAELEAARLDGLRQMVPIRRTFSLAFEAPAALARLRERGRCTFTTTEKVLQREHPGTFGHRIVAAAVGFGGTAGLPPVRGLLINSGVSAVSREDGAAIVMVRVAESLPLGEPVPTLAAGTTAGELLGPFEGTGIETIWTIITPPAANPAGLDGLADVQVTLDLRAYTSPILMSAHLAAMPATIRRFVFLSLGARQPAALAALQAGTAGVTFDASLATGILPAWHSAAVLRNVAVLFAAIPAPTVTATLVARGPAIEASVAATMGIALSNLPPLVTAPPAPPSPLNVFDGLPAQQPFALTVDPAQNPGVSFAALVDVVLGLEYEASLP